MNTPGDVGAFAELLVCADLLSRGFEVFRNVSPNGPVDIVALDRTGTYRIQVKTGVAPPFDGSFDIAAIVKDGVVSDYIAAEGIVIPFSRPATPRRYRCQRTIRTVSGRMLCGKFALPNSVYCKVHNHGGIQPMLEAQP